MTDRVDWLVALAVFLVATAIGLMFVPHFNQHKIGQTFQHHSHRTPHRTK